MNPGEMVTSLRACADTTMRHCGDCKKTFGLGCARDLKIEAAAMIEEMSGKCAREEDRPQERGKQG